MSTHLREAWRRLAYSDEVVDTRSYTTPDGRVVKLEYIPKMVYGQTAIRASMRGYEMGYLMWRDGEIVEVGVQPELQRQGVASAMLAWAREIEPDLKHSRSLTEDGKAWSGAVGAKTAARIDDGPSPLDYEGQYRITNRLSVVDEAAGPPPKHPYFTDDGVVAWVDLQVTDKLVRIAFITVRPDQRGKGHARTLIEEVYRRWPEAEVDWGKLMDDAMVKLYAEYRESEPERTFGGKVW